MDNQSQELAVENSAALPEDLALATESAAPGDSSDEKSRTIGLSREQFTTS